MRISAAIVALVAMKIVLSPVIGASPAYADMISPSHTCSKPIKVSHFASQAEQAKFDRQVRAYKQCLSDFINEQNKEARMHSEAARNATNELKGIRN